MAADFDRSVNATPGGDLFLGDVYRVNPSDRDRGKSGQDRFRETLNRRRQQQDDEDADQSADEQPVQDRVVLSSAPAAEQEPPPDSPPPDDPPPKDQTGHINLKA